MAEPVRGGVKYYGLLLVACAVTFALLTSVHVMTNHALIWNPDGMALYYTFFVYEGEWLRGIIGSLLQGQLEVPLYSFDMGYGADIMATMGGCLNDPFNLVSVLCPPRYAEYALEALIFVRFYLAAVTFSCYSLARGRGRAATFCGALCYVLCGFVLNWGVFRHPNFINLAILLPFIFQGADRVMAGRSPYRLIGGFFLLFFFSLYFSYMVLIMTVVYCLLAFFLGRTKRSAQAFFRLLGKFVLFILLAALMAGVVLVPIFLVLTSMGRVDLVRTIPTWETFNFYWGYGSNLVGGVVTSRSLTLGAVPVLGSLAFFASRKLLDKQVWRPWAVGILLCVAGTLVPWVGSAMNGFGYVTDRWVIILGFCAANAMALVIPVLRRFGRRQWVAFGLLALVLLVWVAAYARDVEPSLASVGLWATVLALVALVVASRLAPRVTAGVLAVAVVACSSMTTLMYLSPEGGNYVDSFIPARGARELSSTVPYDRMDTQPGEEYRIDRGGIYGMRNQALLAGVKGIDFFSSFYNQNVDDARYDLGVSSHWTNYIYNGVEGRFALENLMGAKDFIALEAVEAEMEDGSSNDSDRPPYGYQRKQTLGHDEGGGSFALYESELALPIAFTYDTAVPYTDFLKLGMVQRQELLTRACVLEDDAVSSGQASLEVETDELPVEMVEGDGLRITDSGVEVYEPNAALALRMDRVPQAENYVVFDRLEFKPMSLEERRLISGHEVVLNKETGRVATPWDELKWWRPSSAQIVFRGGGEERTLRINTPESSSYSGKVNWAVNMGYSKKGVKKFTLRFKTPGWYTWDKLSVVSQPVSAIEENLKKLQEQNKASITFDTNRMDINVAPEEGTDVRYVFVSVPYSAGWTAALDGQPVEILKANTGFMAVPVNGAEHKLVFTYATPGLAAGAACTVVGVLGLVALVLGRRAWMKRAGKVKRD